jgi:Raf kinase inhibitor-like YbhB/YbcL family protein
MPFLLTSPVFDEDGEIPTRHTCQGEDSSPALVWTDPPDGTVSFVLIVDDPDAPDPENPKMTWVHWLLYDIPPAIRTLAEATTSPMLPPGTREGVNDWHRTGYGGPCPPIGRHRYYHKLYAVDCLLGDLQEPDKPALLAAMEGHVLALAQLMGTYQKSRTKG